MTCTIGIDLGTTNSLVAVMKDNGPILIPNSLGRVLTPSVVGWDEGGMVLVGDPAREYQTSHPEQCATVFKRQMGNDWSVSIAGKSRSAVDLSSLVLRSLREDAEAYLNQPIEQAVITVPAYFNEEQRRATITAGRMAGLKVDRILNEPTAAAIAYGFHESDQEKIAVVVDLGGGTFDVSVVEMFEGTLEIRASAGEIFLGGEDFTNAVASSVLKEKGLAFERVEMEQPLLLSRLLRECEQAKRELTKSGKATIRIPQEDGSLSEDGDVTTLTREQFDEVTQNVLNRITSPIRRALGDANVKRSEIDEVILVGGATRMPSFIQYVEKLFDKPPRCRINPDEVVALGAAVSAGIIDRHEELNELVVTDVAPFSLGVNVSKEVGGQTRSGYFMPVVNRNSTIPISRVERVFTQSPNQTQVRVSVYQGESRLVKENVLIGEFDLGGIPAGPTGQPVDIRFTYDLNGILEVEATIVETRKKATKVFTRHAKGMSPADVEKAVEEMATLKTHPREEQQNRYLLRRAERLYEELPLRERQLLSNLIDGFEHVLETRDKTAIARFVEELQSFLDMHDSETSSDGESENDW